MLSRMRQTPTSAWTSTTSIQVPPKACPSLPHTQIGCVRAGALGSGKKMERMWSKVHRKHCWRKGGLMEKGTEINLPEEMWKRNGNWSGEKWKNLKTKTTQWPEKQQRKHRRKTMVWNDRLCFRVQFTDMAKEKMLWHRSVNYWHSQAVFCPPEQGRGKPEPSALKLPSWQDDFHWAPQTTDKILARAFSGERNLTAKSSFSHNQARRCELKQWGNKLLPSEKKQNKTKPKPTPKNHHHQKLKKPQKTTQPTPPPQTQNNPQKP